MENPIEMGSFGGKTHYFRKHPYIFPDFFHPHFCGVYNLGKFVSLPDKCFSSVPLAVIQSSSPCSTAQTFDLESYGAETRAQPPAKLMGKCIDLGKL